MSEPATPVEKREHFKHRAAALVLLSPLLSGHTAVQSLQPIRTECLDYQTIDVPSAIKYATVSPDDLAQNESKASPSVGSSV